MASIRKRNGSYLIVVSMGYDYDGNRRKPRQKTVRSTVPLPQLPFCTGIQGYARPTIRLLF